MAKKCHKQKPKPTDKLEKMFTTCTIGKGLVFLV